MCSGYLVYLQQYSLEHIVVVGGILGSYIVTALAHGQLVSVHLAAPAWYHGVPVLTHPCCPADCAERTRLHVLPAHFHQRLFTLFLLQPARHFVCVLCCAACVDKTAALTLLVLAWCAVAFIFEVPAAGAPRKVRNLTWHPKPSVALPIVLTRSITFTGSTANVVAAHEARSSVAGKKSKLDRKDMKMLKKVRVCCVCCFT